MLSSVTACACASLPLSFAFGKLLCRACSVAGATSLCVEHARFSYGKPRFFLSSLNVTLSHLSTFKLSIDEATATTLMIGTRFFAAASRLPTAVGMSLSGLRLRRRAARRGGAIFSPALQGSAAFDVVSFSLVSCTARSHLTSPLHRLPLESPLFQSGPASTRHSAPVSRWARPCSPILPALRHAIPVAVAGGWRELAASHGSAGLSIRW